MLAILAIPGTLLEAVPFRSAEQDNRFLVSPCHGLLATHRLAMPEEASTHANLSFQALTVVNADHSSDTRRSHVHFISGSLLCRNGTSANECEQNEKQNKDGAIHFGWLCVACVADSKGRIRGQRWSGQIGVEPAQAVFI